MSIIYGVTLALLGVAGLLTLDRAVRGPTNLDRVVALDVLVVLLVCGVAVDIAMYREGWNIALLGVVALLGFLGSVTAGRLVEQRGTTR
ncbi:sodium:proton antiporter [Frankia sp. CNm7]|uniref:Sodium:proton antiporter n=1 Tax=Frankia nepalensis TaxID=1836974 RepID=A0A937UMQ6_9ACTN|nr:monovalent cation/H+ antiporter complex subunit F [Frankia nepalensis]MBL7495783.1 sodium:proton antiporter [Frankia nepalensis]MBL7516130.1 sodium:proton antiporter [Frankia nepalensis]MBL7524947.1 sodium:proton antiporter [Frankia nepalensis]MBL7627107.1 sodium:proton antiporter [Frankia nepalensis]